MDPLMLSRIEFGDTAAFHIIWPLMSIGFSLFMFVMEALWLYTGKEIFYRQVRFWLKIFILTFAIGVASGFPLSLQFGTNWANFSHSTGSFFGNLLGFETTIAFTLESAFLGILVFGWNRVSRGIHLLANFLVLFGATLSGFWIVVANSWMQFPAGTHFENGKVVVDNYLQAIFSSESIVSNIHMWFACVEATMFMIAGISAIALLRRVQVPDVREFFAMSFKYALIIALIVAPLQIVVGDVMGLIVARNQPQKLAAIELHWDTNQGAGADWHIIAWPNSENNGNAFALSIPGALSPLITHTAAGEIRGLNDFPADTRPNATEAGIVFYSFRIMVGIGFFLTFLAFLGAWYWYKGRLIGERIVNHRYFLMLWVFSIPLGFIATEAGWMTREIGRQPWVVYNTLRTSEALSSGLESGVIATVIIGINLLYAAMTVFFLYFVARIVRRGPDLISAIPSKLTTQNHG